MPVPKEIVLASGNAGKIREIASIFSPLGVTVTPQSALGIESPEETGATFVENALLKARHAAQRSGLPAIADDSGICVDALNGRPGVRSARYAGNNATDDDNVDRLLEEMAEVTDDNRGGGFHCAAVMVFPDNRKQPLVTEAVWRGDILHRRIGSGGFGYDPVFQDKKTGKTGAQMTQEEKNEVSHRGRAFRELSQRVRELAETS